MSVRCVEDIYTHMCDIYKYEKCLFIPTCIWETCDMHVLNMYTHVR